MVWIIVIVTLSMLLIFFLVGFYMESQDADWTIKKRRKAKRNEELLDESVTILRWFRSEALIMDKLLTDNDVQERIDNFLKKVKKEYE